MKNTVINTSLKYRFQLLFLVCPLTVFNWPNVFLRLSSESQLSSHDVSAANRFAPLTHMNTIANNMFACAVNSLLL